MRKYLVLTAVVLLAACGSDEHSDLRQELAALTKGLRGHVNPLPQVKPYEPVPYTAEDLVDPFRPDRIIIAQPGKGVGGAPGPDLNRPKEPLEAFPLESIQMVGTITQGKETYGLVKAGSNLYRVKQGNYMGQNFGVITSIDESEIKLTELVQDGSGEWVQRSSALQLQEVSKR
ncbi:MAG: pilus assembly protein PilP [Burkholderiales bacterium]|jgi:type IV pilus assembly protein PilP